MSPRLGHDIPEEWRRNLRQPYEHSRVFPIMFCEKEGARVELHQDLAFADRREYQNEYRIFVSEACEKVAIQKEGRKAIRVAFNDTWKFQEQLSSDLDRHPSW